MKTSIARLLFQIEKNRVRLEYAVADQDHEAQMRFLRLLAHLNQQLFDETSLYIGQFSDQHADKILFICDGHELNGRVISKARYEALAERLSPIDFDTHMTADVPYQVADFVQGSMDRDAEIAKSAERRKKVS